MMDKTTLKKVKVVPKKHRFVGDILPNNGRITETTEKNLNPKEIIRAMQFADCFEGETLLTPQNYLDDPTEALIEDPKPSKPEGSDSPSSGSSSTPSQTEDQKKQENVVAGGSATQAAKDTGKAVK